MEREMRQWARRSFLRLGVLTALGASARSFGASLAPSESITNLRRVVTGRNRAGKAIMVHNGVSPRLVTTETLPGLALVEVWATDKIPTLPVDPVDLTTTMQSFVPGPGGTRFRIVQFPGVSNRAFDQEAFRREYSVKAQASPRRWNGKLRDAYDRYGRLWCRHLWRDHLGTRRRCEGEPEAGGLRRTEWHSTRLAQ